ncbi:MAG TPA: helix-turn-helix domain-containing protein [Acidobacteria bacterium]|nr:helix-turn-helix domain-containing protein [Acidobacteriota bacterium]
MYLTTSDGSKRLGITTATVWQLSNNGKLRTTRTYSGQRLFDDRDVEELAQKRRAKAEAQADDR